MNKEVKIIFDLKKQSMITLKK